MMEQTLDAGPDPHATVQLEMLVRLVRNRRPSELEAALKMHPLIEMAEQHKMIALALVELISGRRSARGLLTSISLSAIDVAVIWLVGRCLTAFGEHDLSLRYLAAVQKAHPGSFKVNYIVGKTARLAQSQRVASLAFAAALNLKPDSTQAALAKGRVEFEMGRHAQAVTTLEAISGAGMNSAEATGYIGFAKLSLGEIHEAEALIRRAIDQQPTWFEAKIRLGCLFMKTKRFQDATEWFEALAAIHPGSQWLKYFYALTNWANAGGHIHLEQARDALARLQLNNESYSFLSGGLAEGWHSLGIAYLRLGAHRESLLPLKRSVIMAPSRSRYRADLANAFLGLKKWRAVLAILKRYQPAGRWFDHGVISMTALSLFRLGRTTEAIASLKRAITLDPMNGDAFAMLGRIQFELGQRSEAEGALATAARINPRLPGLSGVIHQLELQLKRRIDTDAGLAQLENYPIPSEFQLRLSDPGLDREDEIAEGLRSHFRAIRAMIRREMLARYGRNQAGYLWAMLQPLMYVATFEIIFIFAQRHIPLGVTLEQFLITGIVPVVCFFMNVEQKVMSAINSHKNLLYFREVTTLNILFAAWLLEFMTAITVMLAVLLILFLIGQHFAIRDIFEVVSALAGLSLIGVVMGGFFGILSLRYASAVFIGRAVNRFLFFLSGAFFYASELPQTTREYILLNPVFHYVELIREGFFTSYQATYASWLYPLQFSLPGLALLLLVDRIFRRHVFEA